MPAKPAGILESAGPAFIDGAIGLAIVSQQDAPMAYFVEKLLLIRGLSADSIPTLIGGFGGSLVC